jgi:hypothetical protein
MDPRYGVIDRYGLPVAVLIVGGLAFYKLVWPLLLRQIDTTTKILLKQLEDAQQRIDKSGDDFLEALKRRDAIMEREFTKLHERLGEGRMARPLKRK